MAYRAHVRVFGRVQGVFFRQSTMRKALSLGLTGWVRNVDDGSVEAVFEGEESAVREIVAWCWKGPEGAGVDDVKTTYGEAAEGFGEFSVRH